MDIIILHLLRVQRRSHQYPSRHTICSPFWPNLELMVTTPFYANCSIETVHIKISNYIKKLIVTLNVPIERSIAFLGISKPVDIIALR